MSHTQEEIAKKLEILYKNIDEKGQKADQIRDFLNILATCEHGRNIIMEMPKYTLFATEKTSSMKEKGQMGFYSSERDTVVIQDTIFTDEDEKKWRAVGLAHEMRHAIQFSSGLFEFSTPFFSKRHTVRKMCELETKLQDALLCVDLLDEKYLPSDSLFYLAEYRYHLKKGVDDERAKQLARDSLARAYWSGLTDMPKKHSEISMGLRRDVCAWNNNYDMQSLKCAWNPIFFMRYLALKIFSNSYSDALLSMRCLERLEKMKSKEAAEEGKKSPKKQREKTADEILKIYVSNMGLSLPFNYFSKVQRERTTVGDCFVVNFDSKGRKKSDVFLLPFGFLMNSYYYSGNCVTIKQEEFSIMGRQKKTEIIQRTVSENIIQSKQVALAIKKGQQRA